MTLNEATVLAFTKGYRVSEDGRFLNPSGVELNPRINKGGYFVGWVCKGHQKNGVYYIHRLAAYQKFGDKVFGKGIQVRHLNGNNQDNSSSNIAIGTMSQNMMDRPPELRSRIASEGNIQHDHKAIISFVQSGKSYKEALVQFGLKSYSVLNYILNKSLLAKKLLPSHRGSSPDKNPNAPLASEDALEQVPGNAV